MKITSNLYINKKNFKNPERDHFLNLLVFLGYLLLINFISQIVAGIQDLREICKRKNLKIGIIWLFSSIWLKKNTY